MPVSMVDERAMSVVTWLNAPKRHRQKVSTMSDHLDGISDVLKNLQEAPRKPVTVNWRDIRATIKNQSMSSKQVADELRTLWMIL